MWKLDFLALLMIFLLREVATVAIREPVDFRVYQHRNELLESVSRDHAELLKRIKK